MTPAELIQKAYPGRLSLTLTETARALGMSPNTAYNLHSKGKFPVKTHRSGTCRPMVYMHELINYLEGKDGSAGGESSEPEKPRKRGRPTKAESLRRAGLI